MHLESNRNKIAPFLFEYRGVIFIAHNCIHLDTRNVTIISDNIIDRSFRYVYIALTTSLAAVLSAHSFPEYYEMCKRSVEKKK